MALDGHVNGVSGEPEDGPLGGLALHDTQLLNKPDIDVVAIEIRWAQPTRSLTPAETITVREAIEQEVTGLRLPILEPLTQNNLTVQFDASKASASTSATADAGQQLRTEDQSVSFAILPHAIAIQVSSGYVRWSKSARPLIKAVLSAVLPILNPEIVARIGLRYVNRLEDDACIVPSDWAGKVEAALLAPYGEWGLGGRVRSANQVLELAIDDDHVAMMRHGAFYQRTGTASDYVLDIDVFSQRARTPDVAEIVHAFTRMNRTALAIFQQSTNPDYLVERYGQAVQV